MAALSNQADTILIIDDDFLIRETLTDYLRDAGFEVESGPDGVFLNNYLSHSAPSLILLDLQLPGGPDGLSLARGIKETSDIPIIMLTGRGDETDRVVGLEVGADDYVTKPFSLRELLARIRAVLRRTRQPAAVPGSHPGAIGPQKIAFDGWVLNLTARRLINPEGVEVELTNGEFSLLSAFTSAPDTVLSRDRLLDLSRKHGEEVFDRSIDVQILRLRRKIERDPRNPEFIKTQRGAGYIFTAGVEILDR